MTHVKKLARISVAACMTVPFAATAVTVEVNDTNPETLTSYQTLKAAVTYLNGQGAGPHTININDNELRNVGETQMLVNVPMTINGDGENSGAGDGTPCDILAQVVAIEAEANIGETGGNTKAYIEIKTPGTVIIRNLRIHTNSTSNLSGTGAVSGFQIFKPTTTGEIGDYTLDNVWVSGSTAADGFVNLDTSTDLYADANLKKWGRYLVGDTTSAAGDNVGPIVFKNGSGTGTYNAHLKNCHAGLSNSIALGVNCSSDCSVTITGGLYGHSYRDGIHADGPTLSFTGSLTNRVRVVRAPGQASVDAHAVELVNCTIPAFEYVDVASSLTGQCLKFSSSQVTSMQFCRVLGKLVAGNNPLVLIQGSSGLPSVQHCTFVSSANSNLPLQVNATTTGNINFTNCIFTSHAGGTVQANNDDTLNAVQSFLNCALPITGEADEILANPPVTNTNASGFIAPQTNSMTESPNYVKVLADYDWSQAAVSIDGSVTTAGNPDVLRPSNANYATAGTSSSALVGGAGPAPAGSSVADWSTY